MICELVLQGKRVGVTAVGHKVIHHLLEEVVDAAKKTALQSIACGTRTRATALTTMVFERSQRTKKLFNYCNRRGQCARRDVVHVGARRVQGINRRPLRGRGRSDVAGKRASLCTRWNSLVLLGDPQQLEQPQKGSHPEGSDISALAHLLNGRKTIEPDRGLFLGTTWRLHPTICEFTSELFYEGRLVSRGALKSSVFERSTLFRERASGSSPSLMMEIRAIQRKRSTASPPSLSTSRGLEPLGLTVTAFRIR